MMTTEQLENEVMSFRQCKADIERLEKQKDAAQQTLKSEMEARNADELIVGVFKITYKEYTRKVFDRQKFIEQWPDLYNQYVKEQTYKTLCVA